MRYCKQYEPRIFAVKRHGSPYSRRGLPDISIIYKAIPIEVEVKRPGEHPTPLQKAIMAKLRAAGATVFVATSVEQVRTVIEWIDTFGLNGMSPALKSFVEGVELCGKQS